MKHINKIVQNTWEMLKFLYDELRGKKFVDFDISDVETVDDLYALIICRWCSAIAREGLYKEYLVIEDEELTSPKGQINIQQSIVLQTHSRGTLICSYDELSDNVYLNQVLKGALLNMLIQHGLAEWIKREVQKTITSFNGIDNVDLTYVKWKDIKYDNNNIRYKHLLEVIKNWTFEKKLIVQGALSESERAFLLFKKQLFKWYKVNYEPEGDIIESINMPFTLDNEPLFEVKINKSQKLIAIKTEQKALLICVRLQTEELEKDPALTRRHMSEMVTYIREFLKDNKMKTAACILYVNTDPTKLNLQPITMNIVSDYSIGVQTVDMYDLWQYISNKLVDIYKYFIERSKNLRKDNGNGDTKNPI